MGNLVGDIAASALCDDETMVGSYEIARPAPWPTLAAYLAALAAALQRTHGYLRHPSDQSVRGGSQTNHLLTGSPDPALQSFFTAIEEPLREHMTSLGHGDDPLRRRKTGEYRIHGAWSVLLGRGGYHRDHFNSDGWLSSAFYVQTPDVALHRNTHEGWLRLGQPPFATQPALKPRRYVQPLPGKLMLFLSYMRHGTEPFTTDECPLTMAFDVVPV